MKKGNSLIAVIVTVLVMLLIIGGLGFAGVKLGVIKFDFNALKFSKPKVEEENKENVDIYSKEYNVDDYVSVAKDDESGLKLVTFKNVESDTTAKFSSKQDEFKTLKVESGNKKTNIVRTNAQKGILSVYTKETVKKADTVISENSYAVNVNIETKENVKNSEVLDLYEVKVDNVCKAVVNKLVEVSADLTYTDSTGAIVNASDIKNNTSKYTEIIKNNIENLVIYSRKDKVYVDVNPISLLKILGLNTSNSSKIVDVTSVAIN